MTTIPSNEIKQPSLHADTLGFTFVWNNHFLRGIYPSAVEQAKGYFESGFIDEVVSKQLFPKTWISDFENEQFGLILEHEMISPVLYATEWNFEMLKDAALMVLDIAQIGWKYGYNMVDCHKLNVLFKNNHPIYVDLGSFVLKEAGSTGWNPYSSYLRSYYYLLSLWSDGASTLAKRMMAPGLEFNAQDYYIYKSKFYRCFPKLIRWRLLLQEGLCRLATWGDNSMAKRGKPLRLTKWLVDRTKPSPSQRLKSIRKKVLSKSVRMANNSAIKSLPIQEGLPAIINEHYADCQSSTFINNPNFGYYPLLLQQTKVKNIVSVQEKDWASNREYRKSRQQKVDICSACFRLLNNTILVRGKYPEARLCSDLAIIPSLVVGNGDFGVHNALVLIEHCRMFAKKHMVVIARHNEEELVQQLSNKYRTDVFQVGSDQNYVMIVLHI